MKRPKALPRPENYCSPKHLLGHTICFMYCSVAHCSMNVASILICVRSPLSLPVPATSILILSHLFSSDVRDMRFICVSVDILKNVYMIMFCYIRGGASALSKLSESSAMREAPAEPSASSHKSSSRQLVNSLDKTPRGEKTPRRDTSQSTLSAGMWDSSSIRVQSTDGVHSVSGSTQHLQASVKNKVSVF